MRTRKIWSAAGAGALALALLTVSSPAASAADDYVKYYTVTPSFGGSPENLSEIADRFLGSGSRSAEIFNLNTGRRQADGKALSDPARLTAGWTLLLPWDAVGAGVQYGVLPEKAPGTAVSPSPRPKPSPQDRPSSGGEASRAGSPSRPGHPSAGGSGKGDCATASSTSSARPDWANLRLAADQAWPVSKGKGQLVAVVDSGVDGSLPQLGGHVSQGMDIIAGSGRGDTDCLGTGTAMAGLIVGTHSGGTGGIAPDATVMPVRIVGTSPKARASDSSSAITAAVGAGATVIALGSYVDTADAGVEKAMNEAAAKDVVVVAGASLASVPVTGGTVLSPGVLRVGGIGMDGQAAADYRAGGVDVVAPGVNVTSLGITGTGSSARSGTQYAVAYVAGAAALVRAAFPDLTAAQVAHRIGATAQSVDGGTSANGRFGHGLIDPSASVTRLLPEETAEPRPSSSDTGARMITDRRTALLVIMVVVMLAAATMLILRLRRLLSEEAETDKESVASTAG